MASLHYISDNGATPTVIYFDIDPVPIPKPQNERSVGVLKCLRGSSAAGTIRTVDGGAGSGSRTLTISIPYAEPATISGIQAIYDIVAQLVYYDANNTITYTCAWDGGNSFTVNPIPGLLQCELTLRLRIISQV